MRSRTMELRVPLGRPTMFSIGGEQVVAESHAGDLGSIARLLWRAMATPSEHLAAQFAALAADADTETGPIQMINMIRFRETAEYSVHDVPEGGNPTGAEAYATYGRLATPFVAKAGGGRVWASRDSTVVVGPESERWDAVFAVRYPNRRAFIDMVTDPGYQAVAHHRSAAVADSRLIMIDVAEA